MTTVLFYFGLFALGALVGLYRPSKLPFLMSNDGKPNSSLPSKSDQQSSKDGLEHAVHKQA